MKTFIFLFFLVWISVNYTISYSQSSFTRGAQVGEIYVSSDFVSSSNTHTSRGLFRSRNNGETLTLIYSNDPSIPDSMVTVRIFNGSNKGVVYNYYHVSTEYLWISKNFGSSWDTVYNSNCVISNYMAGNDSGVIYKVNIENLSISYDFGISFDVLCDTTFNRLFVGNNPGELFLVNESVNDELFLYKMENNSGEFNLISPIDTSITNNRFCYFTRGALSGELYLVSTAFQGYEYNYRVYFSKNNGESFELRYTSDLLEDFDYIYSGGFNSGDFYVCLLSIDYSIPAYVVTINYSSDTAKSFTSYYHVLDETVTIEDNKNILKPEKLEVFPNPANSSFSISIPSCFESSGIIEIYNLHGNVVFEESFNESDENLILNTSDWINGAYVICISDNNKNTMKEKLLVLK